jgi:hypothetical protein
MVTIANRVHFIGQLPIEVPDWTFTVFLIFHRQENGIKAIRHTFKNPKAISKGQCNLSVIKFF